MATKKFEDMDDAEKAQYLADEKAAREKADAELLAKADAAAKAKPAPAPAPEAKTEQDAALEADRKDPVRVNNPAAPEAVAKQHEEVDAAHEKRNEENRPGHAVNMEKIEQAAAEAQARTKYADDHRAAHVPTGKEENRNTPRVLADGTKVWDT